MAKTYIKNTKKKNTTLSQAVVHINSSFNNTILSITDIFGNKRTQFSCGMYAKGARKGLSFNAIMCAQNAISYLENNLQAKSISIKVRGPGVSREQAIRTFVNSHIEIVSITETCNLPHGGPKRKKQRRV